MRPSLCRCSRGLALPLRTTAIFADGTSMPSLRTLDVTIARNVSPLKPSRIHFRSRGFVWWVMAGIRNSREMR